MLNVSIFALARAFSASAPNSISTISQFRSFSIQRSSFSNYLISVFHFSSYHIKTHISQVKFQNIIGTAIKFQGSDLISQEILQRSDMGNTYSDITIKRAMFKNCDGGEYSGGALFITEADSSNPIKVDIKESSFYNCATTGGQGGAFYIEAGYLHISLSCLFRCTSVSANGQAFVASVSKEFSLIKSSVIQCPGKDQLSESDVAQIAGGLQIMENVNFSSSHVDDDWAGFHSDAASSISFSYLNVFDNVGNTLIGLVDVPLSSLISNINFVNNKVSSFLIGYDQPFTMNNCVFISNGISILENDQPVQVSATFNSCSFDQSQAAINFPLYIKINNCEFSIIKPTHKMSEFNSDQCWEISPSNTGSIGLIVFFFLFAGIICVGAYFQVVSIYKSNITNIEDSQVYEKMPCK